MCAFGTAALPCPANPALAQQMVVPKSGSQMSTLRLVAGGGLHDGRYEAGVDLTMEPGSHTYWKIPGEAGVPPVFAFNGSENVAAATVRFPVPSRISEEGIEAYGYGTQVVFPVDVTPADRGKPSVLHVDVTYAVCNKICLPGHGEATLTLPAEDGAELVAAALARVPRPVTAVPDLKIARVSGPTDPTWSLTWDGPNPPDDIFPDAPEGYYFDTKKKDAGHWVLTAQQSVSTATSREVKVALVLARAHGPTQVTETFDVGVPSK